jgi:hypothetical protein
MSTPVRRTPFDARLAACFAALLAVAGCNKPGGNGSTAPDGKGASPTGTGGPTELAPIDHPAQLLPRGTSLLLTGTSVARAAEVLERDRLVAAFGPQYTQLRAAIVATLGHDALDPAAWPQLGLDPSGPVGLSVTNLADPHVVLFATVSDRAKLVELVRRVMGKAGVEMLTEPYGSASILRPKGQDENGVLVLRDRFVVFVLDAGKDQLALARLMATMDPNVSLASEARYRKATGGLRAADMSFYTDVAGMVDQINAHAVARAAEPGPSWAEDELARARQQGASPERLAELEGQVQESRAHEARWRAREAGQRAFLELLVSGIEGVGATATVKRSGPVFDGRVVAGPEAFVRRLLVNRPGAPALPVAMNGAPLWCGSGRVDPTAGLELLEGLAAAEGDSLAELMAKGKAAIGIDLAADLVPVLGGELELCFAYEGKLGEGRLDPKSQVGVGAIVQLTDAPKAKYVLAKMATSDSELGKRAKKRGDGYVIDVPDFRALHLHAAGDRVVLSTDADLAKRLAAGDPGSMQSKIRPGSATGAIGLPGTAASQALDLSMGVMWMVMGRAGMGEPWVVAPGLTYEQMQAVPLSAKSKKAKKAMQKAAATIEEVEDARVAAELAEFVTITDGLGILAVAATEDDRGFTLTGGQFLRAESLGRVVETMLRGVLDRSGGRSLDAAQQKAMDDAWRRYSDAQQAYTDARFEDAAKYMKKKGIKAPSVEAESIPASE